MYLALAFMDFCSRVCIKIKEKLLHFEIIVQCAQLGILLN